MAIDLMTVINFLKETVINLATKKHLDWLIEMHLGKHWQKRWQRG